MKQLLTLHDKDLFENTAGPAPDESWFKRKAARAVVLNEKGEVYLLHMTARNYHKLPGGGLNEQESLTDALYRELLEEIGCPADIKQEVGEIVEYRDQKKMEQHSYCYVAWQNGPLKDTALEEGEVNDGAKTVMAKNIDEAIRLLEHDEPNNYEGHFIRRRDLQFLHEAKVLIGGSEKS